MHPIFVEHFQGVGNLNWMIGSIVNDLVTKHYLIKVNINFHREYALNRLFLEHFGRLRFNLTIWANDIVISIVVF